MNQSSPQGGAKEFLSRKKTFCEGWPMRGDELRELEMARVSIRNAQDPIDLFNGRGVGVSVVIVTYKRHDILACTLEQLMEQDYHEVEIIVVDGSPDTECISGKISLNKPDNLTYIRSAVPWLGVVRNIGMLAATGEIVIFVDDDVYLDRDFVRRHVSLQLSEMGRKVKLVSGNYIARPNEPIEWVRKVSEYRPTGRWATGLITLNCSIQRSAALSCGGFNPYLRVSEEDREFYARWAKGRGRALNGSEIVVVHRCARKGGCRSDPEILAYQTAVRMADEVIRRLSTLPFAFLPVLIGGITVRSMAGRKMRHLMTKRGLIEVLMNYLTYCILKSHKIRNRSAYFMRSLETGRPRVIFGSCIPRLSQQ